MYIYVAVLHLAMYGLRALVHYESPIVHICLSSID